METSPVTCRTLETFYHINGHLFEKQYKESLSGFRDWEQLEHAEEWLLFAENIGPRLAIDETSLSNGELYTFVTNRDAHTREQSLVAVVSGTKSEDIIDVLKMIDQDKLNMVEEVTLDLSDSMRKAVRTIFPRANRVIDRFHIQKLACEAVQELRIKHRWDAIQQSNDEMEEAKSVAHHTLPSVIRMVILARNCSCALVICSLNPLTIGRNDKKKEHLYCLTNTPISGRHMDYAIHLE
jgi:hypothetical protein